MKHNSRTEAIDKIKLFFQKDILESSEVKKIKTLAMAHRIRLGEYRKRFCKKCYSDLRNGEISVSNSIKQIICNNCRNKNRWKIKN